MARFEKHDELKTKQTKALARRGANLLGRGIFLGLSGTFLFGLLSGEPKKFFVKDFGAAPGMANAAPGIQKALNQAAALGESAEVSFEPGIYDLDVPGKDSDYALSLKNAKDVSLNGNGATLRIHNPAIGGVVLASGRNVSMRGFVIDYLPVPFTQGTVKTVDLDAQKFSVEVDRDYPEPDLPWFVAARTPWAVTIREVPGGGGTNWGPVAIPYTLQKKIGEREWLFDPKGNATGYADALKASGVKPGERIVLHARNWASAISFSFCENVTLEDVVIRTSPGLALFPYLSTNVTIRRYKVERPAGTTRLLSSCADGIHPRGIRGFLKIEDCSFEALTDDAISIHSYPVSIVSQGGKNTVEVRPNHVTFQIGDVLDLVNMKNGAIAASPKILRAEKSGAFLRLELSELPNGDLLSPNYFFYNASETPSQVVVSGCTFGNFRGRGVLLRGRDTLITNNTFRMAEAWGVSFWTYLGKYPEAGPIPSRVRIIDNRFYGVGGKMGAIMSRYPRGEKPVARSIRDIEIVGNHFFDPVTAAVDLEGVSGVLVRGNEIRREKPWLTEAPAAWFQFDNCDGVRLEKNTILDSSKGVKAAVLIDKSVPKGASGFQAVDNHFQIAEGAEIRDER